MKQRQSRLSAAATVISNNHISQSPTKTKALGFKQAEKYHKKDKQKKRRKTKGKNV